MNTDLMVEKLAADIATAVSHKLYKLNSLSEKTAGATLGNIGLSQILGQALGTATRVGAAGGLAGGGIGSAIGGIGGAIKGYRAAEGTVGNKLKAGLKNSISGGTKGGLIGAGIGGGIGAGLGATSGLLLNDDVLKQLLSQNTSIKAKLLSRIQKANKLGLGADEVVRLKDKYDYVSGLVNSIKAAPTNDFLGSFRSGLALDLPRAARNANPDLYQLLKEF